MDEPWSSHVKFDGILLGQGNGRQAHRDSEASHPGGTQGGPATKWGPSNGFPTAEIRAFATQSLNPNLNRVERGKGMEKRLRGAINKQEKTETGSRSPLGVGRITSSFVSLYLLYWKHLDRWIMTLCYPISIFFLCS